MYCSVALCGVLTDFSIVGGIRLARHHKFLSAPDGKPLKSKLIPSHVGSRRTPFSGIGGKV
jgi:hypothetical protein